MGLIVLIFSCNESSNSERVNEKEEIKRTLVEMWHAIETGDLDRYATYVHPEFTQFGEYDSILSVSKETELNGIKNWLKNSSDIHTEMIDPKITINGKTAWIVYYWSDNGLTNGERFETRGKSTRIFVKENGKWLCIHGHYTLLP